MDQGLIRTLKAFYVMNLVRRQIEYIDAGKKNPEFNILEVMRMLVRSWDTVSASTVKNCFRKGRHLGRNTGCKSK